MSQPTPLPEPVLEDVDYELWGQNAKMDCYSKAQMLAYGKAEYERGLEDAAHSPLPYEKLTEILYAQPGNLELEWFYAFARAIEVAHGIKGKP